MEKHVGQNLKLLDIVQIFLPPLRKLIAPLGVPSWLRARKKHVWKKALLPKKRIFGTNATNAQPMQTGANSREGIAHRKI